MVERKGKGGSWGYRFYLHGRCYKKYASQWGKTEAAAAEREKRVDLKNNPPLPPTALASVAAAYLVDMAERGLSKWRINAVSHNLENHILPQLGSAAPVASITSEEINKLIKTVRQKGLIGSTTKQVVADARACLNWAKAQKLIRDNPVLGADKKLIGSTKTVKAPLDLDVVERAAESIANQSDRAWFDVTRFTGMRKDETNRLQWSDINFELSMIHIPGSKTEGSDAWLPLAPMALKALQALPKTSAWIFPGTRGKSKGRKVYSRLAMFRKIFNRTGIKLKPKDLRDYFATVVCGNTDANTLMRLMRHTSLDTTTKYMRTLHDSMVSALTIFGGADARGGLDSETGSKTAQNDMEAELDLLHRLLLKYGKTIRNVDSSEGDENAVDVFRRSADEQAKH
jgi:integrase